MTVGRREEIKSDCICSRVVRNVYWWTGFIMGVTLWQFFSDLSSIKFLRFLFLTKNICSWREELFSLASLKRDFTNIPKFITDHTSNRSAFPIVKLLRSNPCLSNESSTGSDFGVSSQIRTAFFSFHTNSRPFVCFDAGRINCRQEIVLHYSRRLINAIFRFGSCLKWFRSFVW